ncbi:MAG: hypothetical protein ABR946_05255, partial [Solirubrobacteraceae bacterium]
MKLGPCELTLERSAPATRMFMRYRDLRRQLALNVAQAEQLRVSEREARLLFEQNPQPMIAYDRATLQIVAVSNAAV